MTTPLADLSQYVVDPASVRLLAYGFSRKKQVVVLGRVDPDATSAITVGMLEPDDAPLRATLRAYLKRPVEVVRLSASDLRRAVEAGHGVLDEQATAGLVLATGEGLPLSADDPVDASVLDLLRAARVEGASSVHLTPEPHGLVVRARVGGYLRPLASTISAETSGAVVGRLATLAAIEEGAHAVAQGSVTLASSSQPGTLAAIDVTVATRPDGGREAVLHLRRAEAPPPPLDAIGLDPAPREALEAVLRGPDGLVLVAGPGGSGRSLALTTLLAASNPGTRRTILLASARGETTGGLDVRAPSSLGPDLASAIAAAESLDADVLGIDPLPLATASTLAALDAAGRGRLVVATVPSIDAAAAVGTLAAAEISRDIVADRLRAVLAPRLVARTCPHCRVASEPDALAQQLQAAIGRPSSTWTGTGCEHCQGTGVHGRIAVFEALIVTPALADAIAAGDPVAPLRRAARQAGMTPLFEAALSRVETGEATLAAVREALPLRLLAEVVPPSA